MPSVGRITTTPLKGTALHHIDAALLTEDGIEGNRRFHLIDRDGVLRSGDSIEGLVQVQVDHDRASEVLRATFPDGTAVEGPAADVGEAVRTDFYGRPVPGRVVEGPFAEAFSTFAGRALRIVRSDREGDGSDVHRLSLVSFSSVADLGRRAGRGDLDARRFRMNLEFDGAEPYEEDTWEGRTVQVGGALLRVHGQVPRCRFTTLDPVTGRKDFDTLTRIAAYRPLIESPRGIPFGMYAEVERPGPVRVGDPVTVR